MKKKNKSILFTYLALMLVMILPVLVNAASVPWSTEQYTATANSDVHYGPPFPVVSSFSHSVTGRANTSHSTITETYMDVDAYSHNLEYHVWAQAEFTGTYTASSSNPLFRFIYDGTYLSVAPGYISEHYAWLTVTDLTNSTVLYNNSSLLLDGNTYTIDVFAAEAHELSVNFGAKVFASRDYGDQTESVLLNYSTAVVPEPISSILFITGGTLLAGRSYWRRKQKA